jgi:probable O-glycosylation ligase (exosortase A-associated)
MLSDNNSLAMANAMGLPICYYAHGIVKERWVKAGCIFVAILTIPGVLLTYSRGAALAMAVGMLFIAWRSRQRFFMLTGGVVLTICFLALAGPALMDRLSTVTQVGVHQSTLSRVRMAKIAANMSLDYPLFGVGFGRNNQQSLVSQYATDWANLPSFVVHNTYLQLLVDSGIFALLLFLGTIGMAFYLLQASYLRLKSAGNDMTAYPLLIQGALLVYCVNALTLSRVAFDLLYILLGCAAVWYEVDPSREGEKSFSLATAYGAASAVAPLSQARAAAPISKQMEAPPRSKQEVGAPLSSNRPEVGIATARRAELAKPRSDGA